METNLLFPAWITKGNIWRSTESTTTKKVLREPNLRITLEKLQPQKTQMGLWR